jgi:hypothetical protein
MGLNYDYYLEPTDRLQGVTHVLPLGSLKYEGWKNLKLKFRIYTAGKDIHTEAQTAQPVKLVLWTRPQKR